MVSGIYDYEGPPRVAFDGHIVYEEDIVEASYDIDPVADENSLDVTISGGSMGSLFAAYGLTEAGHTANVYEKTAPGEMRSRGAGIVMQPELLEFLERNGLADRDGVVLSVDGLQYLDDEGDVLAEFEQTFYLTSWDTTYRSLRDTLPSDRYHMGANVVGTRQDEDSVTLSFDDGDRVRSDLHVVAEGYRSSTRARLLPDVDVEYAGYVCWRGIRPAREFPPDIRDRFGDKFVYYHGSDFQINGYPVPSPTGSTDPDDLRINLVWYTKVPEEELDDVLLDNTGTLRDGSVPPGYVREEVLRRQVADAERSLPDVFTRLFTSYETPYVQGIFDIATSSLVVDRICILGDAAFFIRPHMAAGTAHAAANGLALAEALSSHSYDDLDSTLRRWEGEQTRLGRHLVDRAKERGRRYMQL